MSNFSIAMITGQCLCVQLMDRDFQLEMLELHLHFSPAASHSHMECVSNIWDIIRSTDTLVRTENSFIIALSSLFIIDRI